METTHGKFHCAFASSCFFAYYYNPALDPLPPRRPTKAHKSSLGKLGHNAMRWRILVQKSAFFATNRVYLFPNKIKLHSKK